MENTINLNQKPEITMGNPKFMVEKIFLAKQIYKEHAAGQTYEQSISSRLPAGFDAEDVERLMAGVNDLYAARERDADKNKMLERLNRDMVKLNDEERECFARNFLNLVPEEEMDDYTKMRVDEVLSAEHITAEDMAFAMKVLQEYSAGILQHSTMQAVEKSIHKLPAETVKRFVGADKSYAMAYAAASYVMLRCGKDTGLTNKTGASEYSEIPAYMIGTVAATNVEASRLMSLYYSGKIKLFVLTLKLLELYSSAIGYLSENMLHVVALGLQSLGIAVLFNWLFYFWYYAMHFGLVGTLFLAGFGSFEIMTDFVTTKDIEEIVSAVWDTFKWAWDGCKRLWNRLTTPGEAEEYEAEADVQMENAEEEDEEEEDEEEEKEEESCENNTETVQV